MKLLSAPVFEHSSPAGGAVLEEHSGGGASLKEWVPGGSEGPQPSLTSCLLCSLICEDARGGSTHTLLSPWPLSLLLHHDGLCVPLTPRARKLVSQVLYCNKRRACWERETVMSLRDETLSSSWCEMSSHCIPGVCSSGWQGHSVSIIDSSAEPRHAMLQ